MSNVRDHLGLNFRTLTSEEGQFIGMAKELAAELHDLFSAMGASKERDQALFRLEEAIMWATKHIGIHGHSNNPTQT